LSREKKGDVHDGLSEESDKILRFGEVSKRNWGGGG